MSEHVRTDSPGRTASAKPAPAPSATPSAPVRTAGPSPAEAIALQRSAGNRATARMLARWSAHPDKEKKGILLTDAAVGEFNRFNPPLSS